MNHDHEQEQEQISEVNESDRITKLMNFSGELVILKGQYTMLSRMIEQSLKEANGSHKIEEHVRSFNTLNSSLSKIATDIQSGIMQMRMISMKGILDSISDELSDVKGIGISQLGAETEIDRNVYDQIKPILTAITKNMVDVPLKSEEAEERHLYLKALQKGNYVFIELVDNANGICMDALLDELETQGVVLSKERDAMSPQEKGEVLLTQDNEKKLKDKKVQSFIEQIRLLKKKIQGFQGNVSLSSESQGLLSVKINVPLSLSIYKTLLVKIGKSVYAVPISAVTEIISIAQEDLYTVDGNVTIKLRGHALSLIDLQQVIGLPQEGDITKSSRKVVVITDGEKKIGIFVDSLIGEEDIVIKPLAEHYNNVKGINGASILGDGSIALVLNPISILSTAQQGVIADSAL